MAVLMGVGAGGVPAGAKQIHLIIAASSNDPISIAEQARKTVAVAPRSIVVSTADCGEPRRTLAVAADIFDSIGEARLALDRYRATVKDPYIKSCTVVEGSLLSFRIPAVDDSIAAVPRNAVNWSYEDEVSTAVRLSPDASLAIIRYFKPEVDDPLEGRRERIILARKSNGAKVVLSQNCPNASHASMANGGLALDCARETAGNQLLHSVLIFTQDGLFAKEIEHCREPKLISKSELLCQEESVRSNGSLVLIEKRVRVGAPPR